jgi:transposase
MKAEKIELRKSIIKLHKKGKKQPEISYLLDVPQTVVSYWIRRYKETNNVEDKHRLGKKPFLTKEQIEEVKQFMLNNFPNRYGGESSGWTTKLAIEHIKKTYGVKYSMRRMQELMHILKLGLISPRSEAYYGSKLARDAFRDEFKKNWRQNIWVAPSSISMKQRSD